MRLIDADKLFEFVMSEEGAEILRHSTNMTLRVKDIIERQPTIEAEPPLNYCPECGAKMDGDEE